MSGRQESGVPRRGRGLRVAAVGLAVVVVLLAAVYAALPVLLPRLLAAALSGSGVELERLEIPHPGADAAAIHVLALRYGRLRLDARDLRLRYSLATLLHGRVGAVEIARLELVVDESGAGPAPSGDSVASQADAAASRADALSRASPAALFAAVPARRVQVRELSLRVPARGFRAAGVLAFTPELLALNLRALAPAPAAGFVLGAKLSPQGRITARLARGSDDGAPVLQVVSAVEGQRVRLDGELDLRDFPLTLALSVAGLPAAEGRLTGTFAGHLPWPVPEVPVWQAATLNGSLEGRWLPARQPWRLPRLNLTWQLAAGVASGRGSAAAAMGGTSFQAGLEQGRLDLKTGVAAGRLTLRDESAAQPCLTVDAELAGQTLALEGRVRLRDRLLALLEERGGWPAGRGALETTFDVALPWPLPQPPEARGSGELKGEWAPAADYPALRELQGAWRVAGRELSAELRGRMAYHGLTAGLVVSLAAARMAPAAAGVLPLSATGTVAVGELAPLEVRVEPSASATRVRVTGDVEIRSSLAQEALEGWSEPVDVTAGRFSLAADLELAEVPAGHVRLGLESVSGHYREYAVRGLSSELELVAAESGWRLRPARVAADRVATGVDLERLRGGVSWSGDRVEVAAVSADLLGGRLAVQPFSYALAAATGSTTMALTDVDLAQILALEGRHVSGTGTLDGTLPLRFAGGAPSIRGGRVHADQPGGVIRVSAGLAGGTGQPGADFALRALQDFRYDVLEADVDYAVNGDLSLGVHLEGRNPAVESGRPIHYNVTVTENVPTLLRALRLQDEVTRGIERRLNE